jgi:hypothetical protein
LVQKDIKSPDAVRQPLTYPGRAVGHSRQRFSVLIRTSFAPNSSSAALHPVARFSGRPIDVDV